MSLLRSLLRRKRFERDLDDEMRATMDLLADEKTHAGMPPDEARRAAALEIGGVEAVKDRVRDVRAGAHLDVLQQDLRYAARLLARNPIFALTAALSLAFGIGATTTIFTVANGLLLRAPAGVIGPDRLVDIFHVEVGNRLTQPVVPYADYLELRRRSTMFEDLYAYQIDLTPVSLRPADGDGAERIYTNVVTTNYFSVLGVTAAIGRLFGAADSDLPEASPLVVFSHRFWTRRFNADPAVVGQTVRLNGRPFTVIGIAREGFRGTSVVAPDVWAPVGMTAALKAGTSLDFLMVMMGARLKPGVLPSQAAAEATEIGLALSREHPREKDLAGLPVESGASTFGVAGASPIPGNIRPLIGAFLALLMGLVAMVLVIACANVAGVLLARAAARRREIAVRLAIGASRARLIRQLLTESVLLFALGAATGLLMARGMTSLLLRLLPAFPLPVAVSLPLDGSVVAFATGLSLIAAVLSGLAPALHASKAEIVSALKIDQGPSDRLPLRNIFVVAQMALSILLIVAAGLLARAQTRVTSTNHGFDPRDVEVTSLDLSMAGYTSVTGPGFARDLVARVRQIPGVQAASLADRVLDTNRRFNGGLSVPGVQPPRGRSFFAATWNVIEPGYFTTLRIPLVQGRDFSADDRAGSQGVVVLAAATARRFWPRQNPIGKYVAWQTPLISIDKSKTLPAPELLVVGVVGDVAVDGGRDGEAPLVAYVPLPQRYTPEVTILARTTGGHRIAGELRALVAAMNPNLPIVTSQTLEDAQTGPVQIQLRVAASVSGTVGTIGLFLAAIGVYGVTAYSVARRTREIGIRIALGASRGDIVAMVLRHGMVLVAGGSAIGLLLAAGASRMLGNLLFGVPPLDPATFGTAAVLFAIVGLIACYVPTRRAIRVNAVEALRYE
jgi:predicted permease